MTSVLFRYRAASADGRLKTGLVRATGADAAVRDLSAQGLAVLSLRQPLVLFPELGISRREVGVLFRNVSALTASGVPIERALAASEPLVSARLAGAIGEVRRLVREGTSVADAFEARPSLLPRSAVGILRAGERASALADACRSVAEQLEESTAIEARVRAALAYPTLILAVGLATISVMGTVVVPRFVDILSDLGTELPPATSALLVTSSTLRRFAPAILVGMVVGVPVTLRWLRTPQVRARLDRRLLGLPIVGPIRHGFATARTCRALGGMLESGMPLLAAVDAAGEASGDFEVSRRLAAAREAVARGTPLTRALDEERVFTPSAVQLVGVGESSGRLGAMASRAAAVAGEQAERTLRAAVGLLEPLLVVVLGVLVALVAAALLQAVYSIRPPT